MTYQMFKQKWLGKRVDYDSVYGYQCVDLIKQYLAECYGLKPGAWGNAVNYWLNPAPAILNKFDRIATNQTKTGDIVIFTSSNRYGHVGIADGATGWLNVPTLEQNGSTGNGSGTGGDAIRIRGISKSRVMGVLRPKAITPVTQLKMPPIGSSVKFSVPRTAFVAGTTTVKGTLQPDTRIVRGYDPKYPNRIIVNSASVGNGVAVALFYTPGARIDGWTQI
jgi:surface antigen